jgi:hypothetical protein
MADVELIGTIGDDEDDLGACDALSGIVQELQRREISPVSIFDRNDRRMPFREGTQRRAEITVVSP